MGWKGGGGGGGSSRNESNPCWSVESQRGNPRGLAAVICGVGWECLGLGVCGVRRKMPRSGRLAVRLLVGLTLGTVLCGHGNCDEERAGGLGRGGAATQDLDAQLKVREDYIKALEERISRLEGLVDVGEPRQQRPGTVGGERDADGGGHQGSTEQEDTVSVQDAEIWRRARDKVGSRLSGHEESTSVRLTSLEDSIGDVNVTSLYSDIEALKRVVRVEGNFDSGNTAWVMVASALVLLMTIPGLALFYGGLVRVQNVLSTVMQSFSIACLITVEWVVMGYSLSFTAGSGVIYGDSSRMWLRGVNMTSSHPMMPTVPEPIFVLYELTFAIITPALICGSFADRLKFGPMLLFMGFWHLLVYCPLCHAMWMEVGFLHKAHVLDFAGGNVVHVAAGFSGLVCSFVVGQVRSSYPAELSMPWCMHRDSKMDREKQ